MITVAILPILAAVLYVSCQHVTVTVLSLPAGWRVVLILLSHKSDNTAHTFCCAVCIVPTRDSDCTVIPALTYLTNTWEWQYYPYLWLCVCILPKRDSESIVHTICCVVCILPIRDSDSTAHPCCWVVCILPTRDCDSTIHTCCCVVCILPTPDSDSTIHTCCCVFVS